MTKLCVSGERGLLSVHTIDSSGALHCHSLVLRTEGCICSDELIGWNLVREIIYEIQNKG